MFWDNFTACSSRQESGDFNSFSKISISFSWSASRSGSRKKFIARPGRPADNFTAFCKFIPVFTPITQREVGGLKFLSLFNISHSATGKNFISWHREIMVGKTVCQNELIKIIKL